MKVLKYPKGISIKQITCDCGAELEYTDYDIKSHQMKNVTVRHWIVCPCCHHEITLMEKRLNPLTGCYE